MGSNILTKNRKESSLKVLSMTEQLTKNVISILNDDSKFPKRQRAMFGSRFADNALNAYECLRSANRMFPESKYLINERYKLAIESEESISSLVSDINLLPEITNTCTNVTEWYNNLQKEAIVCERAMKNWRKSETKRYKANMSDLYNKKEEPKKVISFENIKAV